MIHMTLFASLVHRILIIRPDAIGDMVLTLPAIAAIKRQYPNSHITLMASPYNAAVLDPKPAYIDEILLDWFKLGKAEGTRGFWKYVRFLRSQKFDLAIHFYSETNTAWVCYFAGIPYHIGDTAKLGLWPVFRKHGVFLKTFDQTKHVMEYNFQLLRPLGVRLEEQPQFRLDVSDVNRQCAIDLLRQAGRRPGVPLIGVQIGVGFGNRPIEPEKYAEFMTQLSQSMDVDFCVIPHTDREKQFRDRLRAATSASILNIEGTTIGELIGLISYYDLFVSVDTGPFHIASSLGVPQLAIFPSKKVKPTRWAPWRNRHFIVRESRICPHFCPHEGCPLTVCSDAIQVADMADKAVRLLAGDGVTSAEDQFPYWFTRSMTVLIVYETEDAERYRGRLAVDGIHSYILRFDDPNLKDKLVEWDITIIHNLSGKRRWRLWWIARRASLQLFNPPLLVNGPGWDDDLIARYKARFEAQRI